MEKVKSPTGILKINLTVETVGGFGVKNRKTRGKSGQNFHGNKCVQNSTQSTEKVKSPIKIMKIKLDVENADGLGVKKNNEKGQKEGKIYMKINVSRIPPSS